MRGMWKWAAMISIGLAVVVVAPQAAVADCVESGPDQNGITRVDCTGPLSPGYIADPGLENLLLQFDENALVRDDAGNDAVLVNTLSNVSNLGSISVDFPGHAGINVRDGQIQVLLLNEDGASIQVGSLGVPVNDGFGMRVGDGSGVVNDEGAIITIHGDSGVALEIGDRNARERDNGDRVGAFNDGTIEIFGDDGRGIVAGNNQRIVIDFDNAIVLPGGLINTGSIRIEGMNGIGIEAGDGNQIVNSDSILIDGMNGVGIEAGFGNQIFNVGSIAVDGDGSTGIATGESNLIVNGDSITALGDGAVGIRVQDNSIIESVGTITGGSGSEGAGVVFTRNRPFDPQQLPNRFVNGVDPEIGARGVIRASSGVAIQGSRGVDEVENHGDIEGDVLLGFGADRFVNQPGSSMVGDLDLGPGDDFYQIMAGASAIDGMLEGGTGQGDTIVLSGTEDGVFAPDSATGFETLDMSGAGIWQLEENQTPAFQNGAFVNSGTLAPQGLVKVAGGLGVNSGATLRFRRDQAVTDHIEASNLIILLDDSILDFEFEGAVETGSFEVLSTSVSIDGEFGTTRLPDRGLFGAETVYTANTVSVDVFDVDYSYFAETPNQLSVARTFDASVDDATGEYAQGLATLALQTADGKRLGYDQLSPEAYEAQTSVSLLWGRMQSRILEERPLQCDYLRARQRPGVISEVPCASSGWNPWVEGIGFFGSRKGGFDHISYDDHGGGVVVGVDRRLTDNVWLSADIGGSAIRIDLNQLGESSTNSLDVGLAVGALVLGELALRGVVTYSRGWNEIDRDIDFLSTRAGGDFGSNRASFVASAGYSFAFMQAMIQPLISLDYTYLGEEGVRESGGEGMSLDVDIRSTSQFSTTMGLRVYGNLVKYDYIHSLLEWADGVWVPDLSVRWRRVWTGNDRDVEARFRDSPSSLGSFSVRAQNDVQGAEIGAHLRFQPLHSKITAEIGYDGYYSSKTTISAFTANVRVPF